MYYSYFLPRSHARGLGITAGPSVKVIMFFGLRVRLGSAEYDCKLFVSLCICVDQIVPNKVVQIIPVIRPCVAISRPNH